MIGPATEAEPTTPPNIPKTLPRSSGGKDTWMIARICGTIRPAVAPWRNRAAMSMSGPLARPHHADASVNPPMPMMKIFLRPKMSPSLPPVISTAANAST